MQSSGFDYHAVAGDPIPSAPNPQPPSPPSPRQQNLLQETHLDPFDSSNYLNSFPPLDSNLDRLLWSRQSVRPPDEHLSHQDLTCVIATSSASPPTRSPFQKLPAFSATGPILHQNNSNGNTNTNNNNNNSSSNSDGIMGRKPRKRSRASRRTPTTVLTTDTANFRAMVQEFTGIPTPPFPGSLPFPSNSSTNNSRFDLFATSSSIPGNSSSPSYLLRPFAQRLNTPSSFAPSSSSATFSDYHNFSNSNTQNLSNPFHNFHPSTNPFADSPFSPRKLRTLGYSSQGNDDHQAQTMKIAYSSSSHGNGLQGNENGKEKVRVDAMVPDNVGRYTDLQRPHGEQ